MSFEFVTKLPTPTEIKEQYPVPEEIKALKAERDAEIADVITGKSDKLLAIIGPCSADNETAVLFLLLFHYVGLLPVFSGVAGGR